MPAHKWIVMKFGGTSVAGRPQWDAIAGLVRQRRDEGYQVLVVCSAMAGVTDYLAALANSPGDPAAVNELLVRHRKLARHLGVADREWLAGAAALLAGRLSAERVEIWSDVPGLFSADPRLVPAARLLSRVDYDEALEMAASGARAVHEPAIRAAAATRTPLWLCDLNRPRQPGTTIDAAQPEGDTDGSGIKTVTCRPDMVVMLLQNLDARRQVGFLAAVFDVFRRHGMSIELVATSETTTTVSLGKDTNHLDRAGLETLTEDLQRHCSVRRFDDCVCVNLVGRGARRALARLGPVMTHFDERPLLMVSQSANDLCLSLLVPAGEHMALLQAAHAALIPGGGNGAFGPAWSEFEAEQVAT